MRTWLHPLAGRKDLTLEDLAQYPWIVSSPKIGEIGPLPLLDVFVNAGVKPPDKLVYSNAISGAVGLLVKGDFLSLTVTQAVPLTIIAPAGNGTPVVWLDFDWPMPPILPSDQGCFATHSIIRQLSDCSS